MLDLSQINALEKQLDDWYREKKAAIKSVRELALVGLPGFDAKSIWPPRSEGSASPEPEALNLEVPPAITVETPTKGESNFSTLSQPEAIFKVLRDTPNLTGKEIADAVVKMIKIKAKDPHVSIYAQLNAMQKKRRLIRGTVKPYRYLIPNTSAKVAQTKPDPEGPLSEDQTKKDYSGPLPNQEEFMNNLT